MVEHHAYNVRVAGSIPAPPTPHDHAAQTNRLTSSPSLRSSSTLTIWRVNPSGHSIPGGPCTPRGPAGPGGPGTTEAAPGSPGAPRSPAGPGTKESAPGSPVGPRGPGTPSLPSNPGNPLGPGGPMMLSPFSPSLPGKPGNPRSPWGPGGPTGPGGPITPCAPSSPMAGGGGSPGAWVVGVVSAPVATCTPYATSMRTAAKAPAQARTMMPLLGLTGEPTPSVSPQLSASRSLRPSCVLC